MTRDEMRLIYSSGAPAGIVVTTAEKVFGYAPSEGSSPKRLIGTISVTAAGTAVTGTGTAFDTEVNVGDWIKLDGHPDTAWSQVLTVTDATNIVLRHGYRGATGSGVAGLTVPSQQARHVTMIADAAGVFVRLQNEAIRGGESVSATDPDEGFPVSFGAAGIPIEITMKHRLLRVIKAATTATLYTIGKW